MHATKTDPAPPSLGRRVLRGLRVLLIIYLGVFLVLLLLERKFIFHATPASEDWVEAPAELRAEDVTFTLDDGTTIHAWWCPTEGWTPEKGVVHYAHGNAGNLSHRAGAALTWQHHLGMAVMLFDYPGYGKSTGKPTEEGCYAAGEAVWQWLVHEKEVPPERIVLLGRSLGGGISVELGMRHPNRAVVLYSPFTSIPDMAARQFPIFPSRWFLKTRFENIDKIAKVQGPVFIAHGDADTLIPYSMSERLYEAAKEPKELHTLSEHDHNTPEEDSFYEAVREFLNRK